MGIRPGICLDNTGNQEVILYGDHILMEWNKKKIKLPRLEALVLTKPVTL
jgi:hypothetical protein